MIIITIKIAKLTDGTSMNVIKVMDFNQVIQIL